MGLVFVEVNTSETALVVGLVFALVNTSEDAVIVEETSGASAEPK